MLGRVHQGVLAAGIVLLASSVMGAAWHNVAETNGPGSNTDAYLQYSGCYDHHYHTWDEYNDDEEYWTGYYDMTTLGGTNGAIEHTVEDSAGSHDSGDWTGERWSSVGDTADVYVEAIWESYGWVSGSLTGYEEDTVYRSCS